MATPIVATPRALNVFPVETMRAAIVATLEARPKHSCMTEELRRFVGTDLHASGLSDTPEFKECFFGALRALEEEGWVDCYTWGPSRCVRLIQTAPAPRDVTLQSGSPVLGTTGSVRNDENDPKDSVGRPVVVGGKLPDLPEETQYGVVLDDENVRNNAKTPAVDPETGLLIGTLLGPPDAPGCGTAVEEPGVNRSNGLTSEDDILNQVEQFLARREGFSAKRLPDELRGAFSHRDHTISAVIRHDPVTAVLRVQVLLPFREHVALELLELFGQDDVRGTVGVARGNGESHFVVKRIVGLGNLSRDQICTIVCQTFHEAIRACEKILGAL